MAVFRLLWLLLTVLVLPIALQAAGQCVDLVRDCGGKADNHTDNAQAFAVCQHLASQRAGCITVPAGLFRLTNVFLNVSNIEIRVDNGAVFLPLLVGENNENQALFLMGSLDSTSLDYVQNVSLHGEAPGYFTIDLSIALQKPWHARGVFMAGGIKGILLANMLCKMANPVINPLTPSRSENPCIGASPRIVNGVRLSPQDGVLHNLSCTGCVAGYGLMQFHSAERFSLLNLYSQGGATLHLETGGGQALGYVNDIVGKNLTCQNGAGVLVSSPHDQVNGVYHLEDLYALSCDYAINLVGGYSQDGKPPGHFSNSSTITNVVGVYGTNAQNSSLDIPTPSCAPCVNQNVRLNYKVTLTGVIAMGYPPPSNRTDCISYSRSQGCPYQRSKHHLRVIPRDKN